MDGRTIISIARDWSFWETTPPPSIERGIRVPNELAPGLALIVQGVRRAGKSTFLHQLMGRYELDRTRCCFLNFEDPRLAPALTHETLQTLVEAFEAERGPECTYFLDEIQWVDGWQRWLRSQLDRHRSRRFVITGSNAHLLGGELGSALTGRHHTVEVFPFDLSEFRKMRPKATLEEYLEVGGFPAVIRSPDRDMLLRTYFQDIVERDMRERVGARSSAPLRQLVQMLYESAGSELSNRRAAASLGVAVDTTGLYIEAAEDAYMALGCSYFAWSERKRLVRNRKYYPIDTGLRRAAVTATGADRGKQLECAVFLTLRRRFREVHYWRDGGEVDFVVQRAGVPIPVQVTWDRPLERHLRALDEFAAAHRGAGEPVIVTAATFEQNLPELSAEGES